MNGTENKIVQVANPRNIRQKLYNKLSGGSKRDV
jgi:hypothetical protein